MEQKHNRWGVTIVAAALLLMAAANVFAVKEVVGLRRELTGVTGQLTSAMENMDQAMSGVQQEFQNSLDRAKEELRSSIEREESMLAEYKIEVGSFNSVGQLVHVTFEATPKEYHEGVSLFFMYTCDEKASVTVAGERDDNGVFRKEAEIPLSEIMNVKVVISDGADIKTETVEQAFELGKKVFVPLGAGV